MIDKNIATITKAAQDIERQLVETELPAKQIIVLAKALLEHVNATNLLIQIKAAQKTVIEPVGNRLVMM